MWIWPVYRSPNVPNSAASVSWEATIDAPSGLFRQFQGVVRSSPLSRTPVDNECLGSNIQILTTPELMFRVLLTKDGAQRLESWQGLSDKAPAPMHSEACSCGTATCCG